MTMVPISFLFATVLQCQAQCMAYKYMLKYE